MTSRSVSYELDFKWEHPWPRAPIPSDEAKRLAEVKRYHILDTPKEEMFDKLSDITCKTMKCPIAAISFIDRERQWFKASSGLTQAAIPRDVAFCAHSVMRPNAALVVPDTHRDIRFRHNPLVTRASAIRFYATVPICSSKGLAIGTLMVFDTKVHTSCDIKRMIQIASTVRKLVEKRLESIPKAPIAKPEPIAQPQQDPPQRARAPAPPLPGQRAPAPGIPTERRPLAPLATVPKPHETSTLVRQRSQTPQQSSDLAVPQQGTQLGGMLMNLLARTTETQQKLATQQGIMFETLGEHSDQISRLTEQLHRMETKLDAR